MSNQTTLTQPEPKTIPLPPDFPVTWETPEAEGLAWKLHAIHAVEPITPLDYIFWRAMFDGAALVRQARGMSGQRYVRRINTYLYTAIAPDAISPEERAIQIERAEKNIKAAIFQMADCWQTQWLPEIKSHLAFWDDFGLDEATMPELLAHLTETVERLKRLWEIHFLIIGPAYAALNLFDELYHDLFGDAGTFEAYKLLQGFENKTLEMAHALWNLSQQALASPEVRQIIETCAVADIPAALANSTAGQSFLTNLQTYLAVYGQRGDNWGLSYPAWIEDPRPVFKNLKDYLAQPAYNPKAELAALAEERDRAVAAARDRLRGYPQPVVDQFEALLKAAQVGLVLSEDHGFWIDFLASYKVRRVFLAFGRRFVEAGVIESPADIFFLTLDEVRQTAQTWPQSERRQALIAERRAEVDHFRQVTPPRALGIVEQEPPADNLFARTGAKFNGSPPPATTDSDLIAGHPGSPGKIRGRAKIIHSLAEADKLQPGDILVTEATAPPWTPLFATVAAVVTNTGGILSHCAVLAREYNIPAVVGTSTATTLIQDNQYLEVDGDAGLVRIVATA